MSAKAGMMPENYPVSHRAGRVHPAFIGRSVGRDYAARLQLNENC
jgi:hypothetical protein